MTDINTGIVRCIDDLGRLIIPKEIRQRLNIHEGDAFEYILHDGDILIRKHSRANAIASELKDAVVAMRYAFPSVSFFAFNEYGEGIVPGFVVSDNVMDIVKAAAKRADVTMMTCRTNEASVITAPVIVDGVVSGILVAIVPDAITGREANDMPDLNAILKTMQAMVNLISEQNTH